MAKTRAETLGAWQSAGVGRRRRVRLGAAPLRVGVLVAYKGLLKRFNATSA